MDELIDSLEVQLNLIDLLQTRLEQRDEERKTERNQKDEKITRLATQLLSVSNRCNFLRGSLDEVGKFLMRDKIAELQKSEDNPAAPNESE